MPPLGGGLRNPGARPLVEWLEAELPEAEGRLLDLPISIYGGG